MRQHKTGCQDIGLLGWNSGTVEHWTGNPDYCIGFAERNSVFCVYLKVSFTVSAIYIITFQVF